ncbi:hypothetical protein [Scytonema hofmannii]|nr:hypothetical protein [Scytonema hofmannii]
MAIEYIILISRKFELLVVSDVGQASRLSSLVVSGYQQLTTNN